MFKRLSFSSKHRKRSQAGYLPSSWLICASFPCHFMTANYLVIDSAMIVLHAFSYLMFGYRWQQEDLRWKTNPEHRPFQLSAVSVKKFVPFSEYMDRLQMDLIDMRSRPDHVSSGRIFRWILHLKDHFTKFCWAQPLETKEAREVYLGVRQIFFNFGPPKILQSDNGREFVNELITSLREDFPGSTRREF